MCLCALEEARLDTPRLPSNTTNTLLHIAAKIGPSLGEYTRNVVPIITKILDRNRTLYNSTSSSSRSTTVQDKKTELSKLCIKVMMHITKSNESHTSQFSSQMIHVLVRVVAKYEGTARDLQTLAMQGLCQMVCRLGPQFVPYILPIKASLGGVSTQYDNIYHSLVMKAVKGKTMKPYPKEAEVHAPDDWKKGVAEGGDDKDKVLDKRRIDKAALVKLKESSNVEGRKTSGDWNEWMRGFSLELLRQSPIPIIFLCRGLAEVYQPLAHELLNAAFISVWMEVMPVEVSILEISEDCKQLTKALAAAISNPEMPPEILQDLLNMIEFVELNDKKLPIDSITLGTQCRRAHAMAKALRCKELEFKIKQSSECIEALIGINNLLGLDDAAKGVLNRISKRGLDHYNDPNSFDSSRGGDSAAKIKVMPSWQEKLGNWEEALKLYEEEQELSVGVISEGIRNRSKSTLNQEDRLVSSKLGELRCHAALDNSEIVLEESRNLHQRISVLMAREKDNELFSDSGMKKKQAGTILEQWRTEVEVLGAKSAWTLGSWKDLDRYVNDSHFATLLDNHDEDDVTCYFGAVLKIQNNDFDGAQECIDDARAKIVPILSSMLSDFSYSRAHRCFVTVQQLSELEEIISHKKLVTNLALAGASVRDQSKAAELDSLEKLRAKWDRRMEWIPQEPELWRQMLTLRGLLFRPEDDLDAWVKYEKMCRRSGLLSLCHSALKRLGVEDILVDLDSSFGKTMAGKSRRTTLTGEANSEGIVEGPGVARAGASSNFVEEDRTNFLKVNPMHSPLKKLKKKSERNLLAGVYEGSAEGTKEKKAAHFEDGASGAVSVSPTVRSTHPRVMYCIFKYMWAMDHKRDALHGLEEYCVEMKGKLTESKITVKEVHSTKQLLGRCLLKVAKWKSSVIEEEKKTVPFDDIIQLQLEATKLRPQYYKAWHSWALMNYHCVQSTPKDIKGEKALKKREVHVVDAAKGFFRR